MRAQAGGTKNALVNALRRTNVMAVIWMRGLFVRVAIGTCMAAGVASAQSLLDQVNFRSVSVGGFRLYGVSVFSGYSTSAFPLGSGQLAPTGLEQLGGSVNYGASASFGWQHHRTATDFSLLYSATYSGVTRYSELNAPSQSLSASLSRQLTSKWTFTLTGTGQDTSQTEFLNQPTGFSVLSQLPATIDDLAAAFSVGQFSNSQIAAMFTGANMMASPARSLLLGNRVLSYSANTGLNYARSSRLSFHFAAVSAGGQSRRGGLDGTPREEYVLPRSIGMTAGMGMNYSLSSRTQVGLNVEGSRTINRYQKANTTNTTVSIGRRMGMRWFLSVHAGGSTTQTTQHVFAGPASRQIIGGGSLGFRTYTQTFAGSYERTSSSAYGFAVGTITTATGSWSWKRPGSRWSIFANAGQNQFRNTGFASISGWDAAGGISASMGARSSLSAQYVYYSTSGTYAGNLNNTAVHSIRVSLGWSPQPVPQR
jgi:hypothetical protein